MTCRSGLSDKRLLEAYFLYEEVVERISKNFKRGISCKRLQRRLIRLFTVIKRELMRRGYDEDSITTHDEVTGGVFVVYRKKLETLCLY